MAFALVQVDCQATRYRHISAGHDPLRWRNRGGARCLASCGMILGISRPSIWR